MQLVKVLSLFAPYPTEVMCILFFATVGDGTAGLDSHTAKRVATVVSPGHHYTCQNHAGKSTLGWGEDGYHHLQVSVFFSFLKLQSLQNLLELWTLSARELCFLFVVKMTCFLLIKTKLRKFENVRDLLLFCCCCCYCLHEQADTQE